MIRQELALLTFLIWPMKSSEKRVAQCEQIYSDLLLEPNDFSIDESYEFDPDKKTYGQGDEGLKERWRLMLKYEALEEVESLLKKQETDPEVETRPLVELEIEAREKVKVNYDKWYKSFKKVRRSDRFESYLNAFAHLFDPHSDYYNPKEKQDFDIGMSGKLEGIGARLRTKGDLTQVASIVPGGPVYKNAEIEVNDYFLKVRQESEDAVDIFGMRLDDVVSKIRGPKGTLVTLTVQKKDGTVVDITIERDVVNIEDSRAKAAIMGIPGVAEEVGFIHLPKFYSSFEGPNGVSCAADVAKEIEKLKTNNINGLILDLRNNGGGSLRDVVNMSGLFIKDGPIVQVKPRERAPYIYRDEDKDVKYEGPLVILINSFSASASEILAAAMQDYGRAVVVGSQSYGKGTVQRFLDLDKAVRGNAQYKPLGSIKLTMQKFYRIDGGSTQLKGVTPDINLVDRYQHIDIGEREYPTAMPWSEIAPLEYNQNIFLVKNLDYLRKNSQARLASNEDFARIAEQAKWYKQSRDETSRSLALDKFRARQKRNKQMNDKFSDIMRDELASLSICNLPEDMESINFDVTTIARNESWIKGYKKDIYLEEAIAILGDLIKTDGYTSVDKFQIEENK